MAFSFMAADYFSESELHMVFLYLLFHVFTKQFFKRMTLKTVVVC